MARRKIGMQFYCTVCRDAIPEKRQRRACTTCSRECRKEYRRQKKLERDARTCKGCGRPKPRNKPREARNSVPEPSQDMFAVPDTQ